jgi:8-amino-7-oxononanoate synthase
VRLLAEYLRTTAQRVTDPVSPIYPLLIGDEQQTLRLAGTLYTNGFLAPAIRYPTVARGSARLRITLSSAHSLEQIQLLAKTIIAAR